MILLLKYVVRLRSSLFCLKSVLVNMLICHYQSIGLLNPTTDFLVVENQGTRLAASLPYKVPCFLLDCLFEPVSGT